MSVIVYIVKVENIMICLIYDLCIDKMGCEYYCIKQVIQQCNNTKDT